MIGHDHFICHSYVIFRAFSYFYPTGHDVPKSLMTSLIL